MKSNLRQFIGIIAFFEPNKITPEEVKKDVDLYLNHSESFTSAKEDYINYSNLLLYELNELDCHQPTFHC